MAVVQALPVLAVLACGVALATLQHGSIAGVSWLPFAIVIALVAAVALVTDAAVRPRRAALAGPLALVLLGIWAAVSLTWAAVPSLARDEGLLTILYALALAITATTMWSPRARVTALGALIAATGGLGLAVAFVLLLGADPTTAFVDGRLSFPINYANADAAIFLVALWPGIALASRRQSPAVSRALALGGATAGLTTSLLGQSKGAVLGLAVSTVVVLAVSPARLRLLVPIGIVVACSAVSLPFLTSPFRDPGAAPIRHAAAAAIAAAAVAALLGLVYGLVDDRVEPSERARRRAGRLALAALAVAVVAGAASFVVLANDPGTFVQRHWATFKRPPVHDVGTTHLLTLGSNRYDFWRVAVGELKDDPLVGAGSRSFRADYLLHGKSYETPARAHSLVLDALGELGVVGFVLLAVGLGLPLVLAGRHARLRRAPGIAGLGAGTALLAHASVDWIWTFPAVALPGLVALGIGAAGSELRPIRRRTARAVAAVLVLVALLGFAPPWLSARFTRIALQSHVQDNLDRARWLDPLSTAPLLAEAQLEPLAEAIPALRKAVSIEPRAVADRYLLGVAYLYANDRASAAVQLRAALRLKPGDPQIERALRQAGG